MRYAARAPRCRWGGMARLVPAVLELRVVGVAALALGGARAAGLLAGGDPADARAAGLGFAAGVALLWTLWGARTVRTAIRLAMPPRAGWAPDGLRSTVTRALLVHVAPAATLAIVAAPLATGRVPGAAAIAAGALAGTGVSALLAAQSVRRAEVALRRRLLREPRLGPPLGRRSLYLEPQALSEHPRGASATPWPAHRPPPRPQSSAIELDPANPAVRHPVGVRGITTRARAEAAATGVPPSPTERRPPSSR